MFWGFDIYIRIYFPKRQKFSDARRHRNKAMSSGGTEVRSKARLSPGPLRAACSEACGHSSVGVAGGVT